VSGRVPAQLPHLRFQPLGAGLGGGYRRPGEHLHVRAEAAMLVHMLRSAIGCRAMPIIAASTMNSEFCRSSMNALMPNAPSGTRPISPVRPDSFSPSSEPMPICWQNLFGRAINMSLKWLV